MRRPVSGLPVSSSLLNYGTMTDASFALSWRSLHALSDPVRLGIVSKLLKAPAGMNCRETTLKLKLAMPKSTCSQHYRILREAGLIVSERKGVELSSHVRTAELETRFPGLL